MEFEPEANIYKSNFHLNMLKLSVLRELSETCTSKILLKIVHENPFLLDCHPFDDQFLHRCDYIQQMSAKVITGMVQRICWKLYWADHSQSPLDMVTLEFENKELYDTVYFLIKYGAEVDVRNGKNKTPLHALCRRNDQNMVLKTLRLMLKCGKHAVSALLYENEFSIIDIAISSAKRVSSKFKVAKLLLEFGAIPTKNTLCLILSENMSQMEKNDVMKLVKLVMQYLLMYYFKNNIFLVNLLISSSEYDQILDLSSCSNLPYFDEVIKLRYNLIQEINSMIQDAVDDNMTLYSFISKRCTSGLEYSKSEEPILYNVITLHNSKRYTNSNDLFQASMKWGAVLPVLCNMSIFMTKPSGERLTLNSFIVKHLASFLSRKEIINLIFVFWDEHVGKEISAKRCSLKRKRQCLEDHSNEEESSFVDSVCLYAV